MKFETNPQLILTKDEFDTLDKAWKLCRDMDLQTTAMESEDGFLVDGCDLCPFKCTCNLLAKDCVYTVARNALQKIIDTAVTK
jgi:hypothetical protein